MRLAVLVCLSLAGCTVQANELRRPYVTTRLDSPKSADQFAECAARGMGLTARNDEGVISITRKNSNGVQIARWDFVTTNNGSQAELRTGARDDAGLSVVQGCV